MKKVMIVFGTRPEAIKMAPLCHLMKTQSDFETIVCVTGQHRQMLDQVLRTFDLQPDIDLNVMKENQDLFDVTSAILIGMKKVFSDYKPDLVLIHGDTTTAFSTALAAFYSGVPVGHVEAGLRTNNLRAPFPEEFNRKVSGLVSSIHFAPTATSKANLLKEGVESDDISVTGNTVVDALLWMLDKLENDDERKSYNTEFISKYLPFDFRNEKYVLITGHRRENFGDGFVNICTAIKELASKYHDVHFVYPVHLNPKVRGPVIEILAGKSNIHLIEPLGYEPFVWLLKHCYIVLTDSGGIQEEAPSLGKPVLVMRDVTERPEAVLAGTVQLVGTSKRGVFESIDRLLLEDDVHQTMAGLINPYGDGKACEKILAIIRDKL